LDEALRDYIWKQTNQIVRSFIEFKELRTTKYVNMFITNITTKLYDFINLIEKKLMKSKTSSLEEIENKKKLFTVMYVYAVLIKIILDNYESITFQRLDKKGFVKPSVEKLLRYAIDKIILTQNVIINKLTDVNESFLESNLSKAYKNITLYLEKAKLEPPPELDLAATLVLDPIFEFVSQMTVLSRLIREKISPRETARIKKIYEDSHKLTTLFKGSASLKELVLQIYKDEYVYQRIIEPKFPEKITEEFHKLEKFASKDGETSGISGQVPFRGSKTKEEILSEFYEGYLIESFETLLDYVHSKVYLRPIWHVKIIQNQENENIYDIKVKLDDEFQIHAKKMEKLLEGERILKDLRRYYRVKPFRQLPYKNSTQFTEIDIKHSTSKLLSRNYGEKFNKKFDFKLLPKSLQDLKPKEHFHKHKWNIYAYTPYDKFKENNINAYDSKDLILLTSKELKDVLNIPHFHNFKLIDTVCKICLFSYNNIEKDIPEPEILIEKEQILTNFYNYYENRCPEAPPKIAVHEFDKNGKCKYCGFMQEYYASKDIKYFDKYLKKFQKETQSEKKGTQSGLDIEFNSIEMVKKLGDKIPDFITSWKYHSNIVNELVAKTYDIVQKGSQLKEKIIGPLKVKKTEYYNMLINLGLVEKIDYEEIINGKENPYKKLEFSPTLPKIRINKLDIYIKELIFDYTILINYKNLSALPLEIKIIINEMSGGASGAGGIGGKELENISKLDLFNTLYSKKTNLEYFKIFDLLKQYYYQNDVAVSQFLLEYLCSVILSMLSQLEKNIGKKFAHEFLIYIINKIFLMEKASSKLKESKSAAIEATQKLDLIDNPNMQDHTSSRSYDDLVQGNVDKFSYNEFDFGDPGLDSGAHNSNL
jgi:hypothetical protein